MKKHPIIKLLTSTRLTVICLFFLIIVVIWGTVYQVENGLYQAQQKFFYSWFIPVFGFFPVPGTVLIFWVLFFNVFFSLIFRIPLKLSNLGNLLIHVGIVIFFIGSFFTYYYSQESVLSLQEGQEKNFSVSVQEWELAVWKVREGKKFVNSVDTRRLTSEDQVEFSELDVAIQVKQYYRNCIAYKTTGGEEESDIINSSGIGKLEYRTEKKEPSENITGIIFSLLPHTRRSGQVLLYGADSRPTSIQIAGETVYFSLRKKRFWLPFSLKLIDFERAFHPGSDIVKSYESKVKISIKDTLDREVIISMNKPLRYKNFTLYQSSYFIAQDGTEYSFLAVVKNFGKLFPYISSIIVFLGLCIHFLWMLIRKRKNREKVAGNE
jgi:cytochrome c biogenesis protein ResB